MTPPRRCTAFGRRIATDIVLPGAVPDDETLPAQLVIRRLPPRPLADPGRTLWRDGETLRFAPPGVAAYRCTASAIDVTPVPAADEDDLAALLIATALPGLLWLSGAFVLHAAAAVLPGCTRAVAIAAASGTGKSTMLAALVARGARVVADDSLCLRPAAARVAASGLAGGWFARRPEPAPRAFVPVAADRTVAAATLGAILMLNQHEGDAPARIARLSALAALTAILSHRHRPSVPALFGDPAQRLDAAARIARTPSWHWSRAEGEVRLTGGEWETILRLGRGTDDG